MSKTIDEKVVEMKFDNKNFEANVQTTMSTLDKLKAKLNLTGASKGLEEVQKSTKKLSFDNVVNSLSSLEKRFSVTGIAGMTVIQNLTNEALKLGRVLSSYSIGGIVNGGYSRASKIENAQFQIKGLLKDLDDADEQLNKIMEDVNYGVQDTAYGLDAAATVASQLVASGIMAGDGMKAALRGVSGVAAMTNSSYEDIGRIYTQVAGQGRLMGQDLLQLSSRGMNAAAVIAKSLHKTEAEVRDMVSKGEINFEIFSKAMDDAFGEHAKDANKTLNGTLSNIRAALAKIGADFYTPLIKEGSPLIAFLNNVRNRINEFRNTIAPITEEVTTKINKLITVLNNGFVSGNVMRFNPLDKFQKTIKSIKNTLETATAPLKEAEKKINQATKAVQDYEKVVDEIINGKWGTGQNRFEKLAEAGYNWAHAQNMVNEKLGNSFRHAEDYAGAVDVVSDSTEQMSDTTIDLKNDLENLTDEQLRNIGFTEDQIEAMNELRKMSKKTGIPIKELIDLISKTTTVEDNGVKKEVSAFSTRYLLLNSLKNIGMSIAGVFKAVGKAFSEVFTVNPESLFDLIAAFHKLTVIIKDKVERNAENLTNIFKGLFSIIHILSYVIGGGFKLALTVINAVLGAFNLSILDVVGAVGEAIFKFDRWITSNGTFISLAKSMVNILVAVVKCIAGVVGGLINWGKQNPVVMAFINNITKAFNKFASSLEAWTEGLKETDNIPKYIFQGLINGLKSGASSVFSFIGKIGQGIVDAICKVLGIHSPSLIFYAIGGFLIAGLIAGLQDNSIGLFDILKGIGNTMIESFKGMGASIVDMFKNLKIGDVIAVAFSVGILGTINKVVNVCKTLSNAVYNFSMVTKGLGRMFTEFGDAALEIGKGFKYKSIAAVIKSIALALLAVVGSIVILGNIPVDKLKQGGIAVGIVSAVLVAIVGAVVGISKVTGNIKKMPSMASVFAILLGVAASIFLVSKAMAKLGDIEHLGKAIGGITVIFIGIGALMYIMGTVADKVKGTKNIEKLSKVFTKIGISMLIIAEVMKIMDKIKPSAMVKTGIVLLGLVGVLAAIGALKKMSKGYINKAEGTIKQIGVTLLLLAACIKLCEKLTPTGFKNALKVVEMFLGIELALAAITKVLGADKTKQINTSIAGAAISIGILGLVAILLGKVDEKNLKKGVKAVGILGILVAGLLLVSRNSESKNFMTLIGVTAVIIAMGLISVLLGHVDEKKLKKGIAAMAALTILVDSILLCSKKMTMGKNATKGLLTIAGIIVLLTVITIGMSFMDSKKLLSSAGSLSAVILSLSAFILAVNKMKDVSKKKITTLFQLSGLIFILGLIIAGMAAVPSFSNIIDKTISLVGIMAAMAVMLKTLDKIKANANVKKAINALYRLSGVIFILGFIIAGMAAIPDNSNVITKTLMVAGMMFALTKLLESLDKIKINNNLNKTIGSLALLTGVTLIVAGIITAMSYFPNNSSIIANVLSLTEIIYALTGVLALLNKIKVENGIVKTIGILTLIAVPLAAFAGVLGLMNVMEVDNAIKNATALSMLAISMTVVLAGLGIIGTLGLKDILVGVVGLTAMAIPLLAFVGVLSLADGISNATKNAKALSKLATTLTILLVPLTVIGAIMTTGVGAVAVAAGVIALTAMAIPLLAFVGVLSAMSGIPNATKNAEALTTMMEKITLCLVAISLCAPGLILADVALAGLIAIIGTVAVFAVAVGALMEKVPALQEFLNTGLDVLIKVAEKIGEMIGAFVAAMANKIADILPNLGDKLSQFMKNGMGFFVGLQIFDKKAQEGAKILCEIISELMGDAVKSKLGDILGINLEDIGTKLSDFMRALNTNGGFLQSLPDVDNQALEGIKTICDIMVTLQNAALKDTVNKIISKWCGIEPTTLSSFASQFGDVAKGIQSFKDNLGELNGADVEKAKTATSIVGAFLQVADEINQKLNNQDFGEIIKSIIKKIGGITDENLSTMGKHIASVGKSLNAFKNNIGTFTDADVERAKRAANVLGMFSDVLGVITGVVKNEESFGFLWVSFEQTEVEMMSMEDFLDAIPTFIEKLKTSLEKLEGVSMEDMTKFKIFTAFVQALIDISKLFSGEGKFFGGLKLNKTIENISTMGTALTTLKTGIDDFISQANEIATEDDGVYGPKQLVSIEDKLREKFKIFEVFNDLGSKIDPNSVDNISKMSENLKTLLSQEFKDGITRFSKDDIDEEKYTKVMTAIKDVYVNLMNELKGYSDDDTKKIDTLGTAISNIASIDFDEISGDGDAADKASKYGEAIVTLAKKIQEFYTKMTDDFNNEKFTTAMNRFNQLKESTDGLSQDKISNINAFADSLESISTNALNAFMDCFKDPNTIDDVTTALGTLINDGIIKPLEGDSGKKLITTPAITNINTTVSDVNTDAESGTIHNSANNIGSNIAQGIINGLNNKSSAVYQAAYSVGQQATTGAANGAQVESPSKEGIRIGKFVDEGLMIGLQAYSQRVYNSSYDVADGVRLGLSRAMIGISNIIEEGIDDNDMSITPVLDLSQVESGMSRIGNMFDSQSFGVRANLSAISRGMNNYRQNGNEDVVNAVNRLGKNLGNPGNTYNINGITYDNGSEVSNAIETLVRAVKIERRR